MHKFQFTKKEAQELLEKIYVSDIQKRIFEYRMLDYSITKMAMIENCSESKINREIKKIAEKIRKVL